MAQAVDFYIDVSSGQLVSAGSAFQGTIPALTRNDTYTFRLRLQERDADGILRDINTSGLSAKLGIGGVDDAPSDGQFKLVLNSVTSSAISYNATTAQLATAISAIAGAASVVTYGSGGNSWLITSATANTAMSFGGVTYTLFPASAVLISTRRFPRADVAAQQIVQLRRSPAVFADTFITSATGGVVSLTKLQDGGAAKNESFLLKVGRDAIGGSLVLNYGANSTTGIPVGATAASYTEALSAVTGIGPGNISVDSANNQGEFTISFVKALGNTNITTGFTLDASGVVFAKFIEAAVTMATAELDELFAEAGTDTITPTLEVEITQTGRTATVLQSSITIRRDLITTGSAVPGAQASYYTKAETNAAFVAQDNDNVDATARQLNDSSSSPSVDWENKQLKSPGIAVNWGSGELHDAEETVVMTWWDPDEFNITQSRLMLNTDEWTSISAPAIGFFGSAVTAQRATGNVVSGLIAYGLFASGATYGVLPQTLRTLTATASLSFGNVASHGVSAVTAALSGAAEGDVVLLGLPNSTCAGLTFQAAVSGSGVVRITALNVTTTAVTQSAQTFRITALGY